MLTTLKKWLLSVVLGAKLTVEMYTTHDRVFIAMLKLETRLGNFVIPVMDYRLPEPGEGYIVDMVAGEDSLTDAGVISDDPDQGTDVDEDTRPA